MPSQSTSSLKKLVSSNMLKHFRLFCWAFAKCDLKCVAISTMKWSDFDVGRQLISLKSCLLFVNTRSRILPALWVGFLTIWERSCLDWNDAIVAASWLRVSCGCPSVQSMLGRLKSPHVMRVGVPWTASMADSILPIACESSNACDLWT